jgi:hypothetical protein
MVIFEKKFVLRVIRTSALLRQVFSHVFCITDIIRTLYRTSNVRVEQTIQR